MRYSTLLLIFLYITDWKWREDLSTFSLLVFSCGFWVHLESPTDSSDTSQEKANYQAPAMALDTNEHNQELLYVLGGYNGQFQGDLTKFSLPVDYCNLFQDEAHKCKTSLGCAHCAVFDDVHLKNDSFCYSNSLTKPSTCTSFQSGTLEFDHGVRCDLAQYQQRCEVHQSCGDCLSTFPNIQSEHELALCVWCPGCSARGKCLPRGSNCLQSCPNDGSEVTNASQCPEITCAASDCEKCQKLKLIGRQNCVWNGEKCTPLNSAIRDYNALPIAECPKKCHLHEKCQSCLASMGCLWSTDLSKCVSMASLECLGGTCGTVLSGSKGDQCPTPCSSHSKCKSCLQQTKCGWCSLNSSPNSGMGTCLHGTVEGPEDSTNCDSVKYPIDLWTNIQKFKTIPSLQTSWDFFQCPPENECLNGHHDCDPKTQVCQDTLDGYTCKCNDGYEEIDGLCKPICSQGCVNGDCIEPGKCKCHFSFVGDSCEVACDCNGHSDCLSSQQRKECLECKNNTMGNQCQHCK